MGKHSKSAGDSKKSKPVKSLVADETVVDPGLAALFASSVSIECSCNDTSSVILNPSRLDLS